MARFYRSRWAITDPFYHLGEATAPMWYLARSAPHRTSQVFPSRRIHVEKKCNMQHEPCTQGCIPYRMQVSMQHLREPAAILSPSSEPPVCISTVWSLGMERAAGAGTSKRRAQGQLLRGQFIMLIRQGPHFAAGVETMWGT